MSKHSDERFVAPREDQSKVALICLEALAAHEACAVSEDVISSRIQGLADDIEEEFLTAKRGRDAAIRAVRLCPSLSLQDIYTKARLVMALSADLEHDPRIGVMSFEIVRELLQLDLANIF